MQFNAYVQGIYLDDACWFAALFVFAAVQPPAPFVFRRRAPLGPARSGGVVLLEDTDEENCSSPTSSVRTQGCPDERDRMPIVSI